MSRRRKLLYFIIPIVLITIGLLVLLYYFYFYWPPPQTSVMIYNDANEPISGNISFGNGKTYSDDRRYFLQPKEEYEFEYNKPIDAFIRLDYKLKDKNYRYDHYIDILGNVTLYYKISNDGDLLSGYFDDDKSDITPLDYYNLAETVELE